MNIILIAVLVIVIGETLLGVISDYLNLKQSSPNLPRGFESFYDQEKYKKSQNYLHTNTRFSIFHSLVAMAALVAFILLGGFNKIDLIARQLHSNEIIVGLIFVSMLGMLSSLLELPFSLYSTFVIEEKFGFNKMTLKTFFGDRLKGLILTIVIGSPILAVIFWFFDNFGDNAWLYCWLLLVAVQIVFLFLAPVVIFPLFNKFEPLPDGELKNAIHAFAKQENFLLNGIFVTDGSKRSTKANAYFVGFGKFRRIALFDTLIQKHSIEELVAILAHEIGHYKEKHIWKQMTLSFITSMLMFYVLGFAIKNPMLFEAFGMEHISVYASIIFFGILYSPLSTIFSLANLYLSRKYEFEADDYSLRTYKKPLALAEALRKLSVENLANLTPHPLKVFLEYTHPPVIQRIKILKTQGH